MTFTTLTFLLFLPVVFAAYWLLKDHRGQNLILLVASYFFYGWWDYRFCFLLLASSLADYGFGLWVHRCERTSARRAIVAGSIIFNLGVLGYFKYFNFFAESITKGLEMLGWRLDAVTIDVILPAGISFYTFQSMSYVLDVYRRQIKPAWNVLDYLTYVSFFPQLVAGPIQRGTNLLPQILAPRVFNYQEAVDGLRLILWGFFKKLAVAENLAPFVNEAYASPQLFNGPRLAFATLCFAFQIYCDFSAYSDIAIGTGRLFGIKLMRNFAYPYFSQNIAEFWRRWHISLSTWFRDYVYVPLGGSRVARPRLAFNLALTFLICGLWHGAAWTFVVWGALNGLALVIASVLQRSASPRLTQHDIPGGASDVPQVRVVVRMLATFAFICVTWVFFRAHNLHEALLILGRICSTPFQHMESANFTSGYISSLTAVMLIVGLVLAEWLRRQHLHPLAMAGWPRPARWGLYSLMIWGTIYLIPPRPGGFIYFQF